MDQHISPALVSIPDDGMAVTTAEPWVRNKMHLIKQHLKAFTSSLAGGVEEIIFVDLYARNGLFCLGAKSEIFSGVPIMALQLDLPISKYVLCEEDPEQFRILKIRVNKYFRDKNVILLNGKPQDLIDRIKLYVPESRKNYKVATVCVADSFALEPGLELIHQLGLHGFSFIVPLTFHLGNKLNYKFYLGPERARLATFLGFLHDHERTEWKSDSNSLFYKQLVQRWKNRLQGIGLNISCATQRLDSGLMEIPTYQLGLITTKYSARNIQMEALAGNQVQFGLFNQN